MIDIISGNEKLEIDYYENLSQAINKNPLKSIKIDSGLTDIHPPYATEKGCALVLSHSLGIDSASARKAAINAYMAEPDIVVFKYLKNTSQTYISEWLYFNEMNKKVLVSLPFRSLENIVEFISQNLKNSLMNNDEKVELIKNLGMIQVFDGLTTRAYLPSNDTRELLNNGGSVSETVCSFAEKLDNR